MSEFRMSECPNGTGGGTTYGTPGVSPSARPHVRPGVACWVQSQKPEPEVLVKSSCFVFGHPSHPSLQSVRAHLGAARSRRHPGLLGMDDRSAGYSAVVS